MSSLKPLYIRSIWPDRNGNTVIPVPSVAEQLGAFLDKMGGILWLPNQHNYTLTTDTAVADSGDPVGYMGSHRQNLPENYVKNSMMVGAGAGVWPTYWSFSGDGVANDITFTPTGSGTDENGTYLEIAATGTAGGAVGVLQLYINSAAFSSPNHADARIAQLWSGCFKIKNISGTPKGIVRARLWDLVGSSTGAGFTDTTAFTLSNDLQSVIVTRVTDTAGITRIMLQVRITVAVNSGTWDNVFRIYAPQLERGKPTAFTPTYGEAISRGVNFEPAWQDTTAAKPILGVDADGKAIATFDGTDDFFRIGIQTPEAGYIAGVWKGSDNGAILTMFGSASESATGAVLWKLATNTPQMRRYDGTSIATVNYSGTLGSDKAIWDAHYALSSTSIRKNGAGDVTSSATRNATSTNYFRIGAACATGGDTQNNFWNGHMLAQVWIPGARPGATAEAEIRRLLAELTAVSGVV